MEHFICVTCAWAQPAALMYSYKAERGSHQHHLSALLKSGSQAASPPFQKPLFTFLWSCCLRARGYVGSVITNKLLSCVRSCVHAGEDRGKISPMSVRKNSHYAESTSGPVVSKLPAGRDAHPSHQFKNMFTRKLLMSCFDYIGNPVRWSMHANKSLIFLCIVYNLGFICLKWGVGWITV